jgi:hypothetical protein
MACRVMAVELSARIRRIYAVDCILKQILARNIELDLMNANMEILWHKNVHDVNKLSTERIEAVI